MAAPRGAFCCRSRLPGESWRWWLLAALSHARWRLCHRHHHANSPLLTLHQPAILPSLTPQSASRGDWSEHEGGMLVDLDPSSRLTWQELLILGCAHFPTTTDPLLLCCEWPTLLLPKEKYPMIDFPKKRVQFFNGF